MNLKIVETPSFAFDAAKHVYTFDGKALTGVTTVLACIAKPALIQWAANCAVNHVKEYVIDHSFESIRDEKTGLKVLVDDVLSCLEEARTAHRKKKEEAGSKGTDIHGSLEQIIKTAITSHEGYIPEGIDVLWANDQITKFCNWARENKVRFLDSERKVYSLTHWTAGTLDFLCEIDGKKYVGDIKTSSGIYGREYFAQCGAYRMMLEEMGEKDFAGSVVIRVGKDGSFEEKFSYDYETDKKLFLACLDVYRAMGTFETK